ncbi:unnamed protein product [Didymodactylos carnosus]|uniref:Uncharacterized protein n=1 Tax=Didymodactylos carnosus TaxID=1234261 RepID=A0A8S2EW68_9BILA|nr:unnamed protein product [Didymodactylos carnosus]CAF4062804.1 unnamed protein product [Didymodactylos carnosus]
MIAQDKTKNTKSHSNEEANLLIINTVKVNSLITMSNNQKQQQSGGVWESHSSSSKTTKVDNQPFQTVGSEADAKGIIDQGKTIVTDSQKVGFTDKGHPGTLEYSKQ